MANTIDKEIVIAYVADIGGLKPVVDIQQKIGEKFQKIHEEEKAASEKATQKIISDRKKINEAFQKNIDIIREETTTIQQAEKIFDSFRKTGEKAFDNKKITEFSKKVKTEFDKLINLSKFSIKFDDTELKQLSALINSTDNVWKQLSITISAMQGKLDALDFKDEDAKNLSDELRNLKPQVEALSVYFDEASESSSTSLKQIKSELQSVKDYILQTESELKNLDSQIESIAPGKTQAGLIQEREKLNQSLEEAKANLEGLTQEYKTLESETKNAANAQKTMGTELRSVKEEMGRLEIEGKQNTEQYKKLKDKAVELQKSIKDVNDEIKHSSSNTAAIQNVIGAISGLIAVYEVAEGASVLLGEENEELHETLVKLTSVMAVLQGLQEIQNQLTEKTTLANKALTWTQNQYTIATDASATATVRLGAALKLLGIGLLVGALALAVVYWKDIAKWVGISSDEIEKSNELNKRSIEIHGEEIAKLDTLTKVIKDSNTSLEGRKNALKDLIELNPEYLKGLTLENIETEKGIDLLQKFRDTLFEVARAKAAQELIFEYQKKLIENELKLADLQSEYDKRYKNVSGSTFAKNVAVDAVLGLASSIGLGDGDVGKQIINITKENEELKKSIESVIGEVVEGYEKGAFDYGEKADKATKQATKATKDWAEEIRKLIAELVKVQEAYKVSLIKNDREREIAERRLTFEEEKKHYQEQIDAIEGSGEKKLAAQRKFNEIYNTENGIAYEVFQKDIVNINEKYSKQAEEVRLQAMTAIREVNKKTTSIELQAIKDRWDEIRKKLRKELELTNDVVEQAKINKAIQETTNAQKTEENKFLLGKENEDMEIQQQMADRMISIWTIGNKKLIGNERLVQTQRLLSQKISLEKMLANQKKYLDESQKMFLEDILNKITTLGKNATPEQWQEIAEQMNDIFSSETAKQILEIVQNLKDVNKELDDLEKTKPGFEGWFTSSKDFAKKIGELLKIEGEELKFFSETIGSAIETMWNATSQIMAQNVQDHQQRLSEIENLISQTESELDREKDLYEQGYANNYELKKKELEDLKRQKAEEKKELEKAQKIQQAMNQASILSNLATTSISLVKSAAQVMEGSTKIPIVGVALGIGLIATMMAAMMAMKSQAQSFSTYRTGLEAGPLMLNGPSHERGGMGLYDSGSGKKVAEYEGGEQLFALNKGQQSKYGWLMQMMINDAKGKTPIMDALKGKIPNTGKKIIHKVREVNEISRSAHQKRAEASQEQREMLNEIKKLNKRFDDELGGFKKREIDKTEFWETPTHFHVKKNGITRKYRKKPEN